MSVEEWRLGVEIYACEVCGSSSDEEAMCPTCDRCVECCDDAGFYGFDSTDQLD